MIRTALFLCLSLLLMACEGPEMRFDAPPLAQAPERIQVSFARIEVLGVSLPAYAQSEEIHMRDDAGAIVPLGPLWADEPGHGLTREIARELSAITGRLVAPDPWPFREAADVRVDVRFDAFLASSSGVFRIAGQVFVAPEDAARRDRASPFDIALAVTDITSPAAIASARAEAVRSLAQLIARSTLR